MRPTPIRGLAVLGLAMVCLAALPAAAQDAADPFDDTKAAFMAAEGFDARMAILTEFLAENPNHPDASEVLQVAADLYIGDRDDRAAAVALAEHQRDVTTDAEVAENVRGVLMGLYGAPVYAYKLELLVNKTYDPATMTFGQHLDVLEAATAAAAWPLVDAQCKAAEPKANAATFRADFPDREFTAEEIEVSGKNREGLIQTFAGWSLANQDNEGKALKTFGKANDNLRKGYLGVPSNDLYRYWGETLLAKGKQDEGLTKLTLASLYADDGKAGAIARERYAEFHPGESYDDFAWQIRLKHAPVLADFSAADYQGTVRSFHELKGKKATLVAFWFPT